MEVPSIRMTSTSTFVSCVPLGSAATTTVKPPRRRGALAEQDLAAAVRRAHCEITGVDPPGADVSIRAGSAIRRARRRCSQDSLAQTRRLTQAVLHHGAQSRPCGSEAARRLTSKASPVASIAVGMPARSIVTRVHKLRPYCSKMSIFESVRRHARC
jgi:hypothetical protein